MTLQADYPVCSLKKYLANEVFFEWTAYSWLADSFIQCWLAGCNNHHSSVKWHEICFIVKPVSSNHFAKDIKGLLRVKICQYKWSFHRFYRQIQPIKPTCIADLTLISITYSIVIEILLESDLTISISMYLTVAMITSSVTQIIKLSSNVKANIQ